MGIYELMEAWEASPENEAFLDAMEEWCMKRTEKQSGTKTRTSENKGHAPAAYKNGGEGNENERKDALIPRVG